SIRPRRSRRGNHELSEPVTYEAVVLQFGHGVVAVETPDGLVRVGNGRIASIRPRRSRRGNFDVREAVQRRTPASIRPRRSRRGNETSAGLAGRGGRLQFGHGVVAVET